jgi:hypothetical protein
MEILILGVLLVALMAYVSTRIKKSAAQAFERETIETEDFRLVKPEGYLHVLGGDSEFAFEAYSKEFGEDGGAAAKMRRSEARVKVYENPAVNQSAGGAESEETRNGVPVRIFRKMLQNGSRTFELEISVLREYEAEFSDKAQEMLDSFQLK